MAGGLSKLEARLVKRDPSRLDCYRMGRRACIMGMWVRSDRSLVAEALQTFSKK